jgi:hypothetical protein
MRRPCRPLEGAFVEFGHGLGRMLGGDSRSLQHFMVERHGQLVVVQVRAEQNVEAAAANDGLRCCRSVQWIQQRLCGEACFDKGKATAQSQVLESGKVEHASSVPG